MSVQGLASVLQSCCRSLLRMGAVVSLGLALPHYEASPHPKGPPAADYRVTPVVFGEQYMSGNQFSLAVSTKIDHDDLREKGDVMDSRGRRHFRICGEENAQRNNCWLVLDATGAAVLFISKNTDSGAWQLCRDNERRVLIIKSQSPAKRARFQVAVMPPPFSRPGSPVDRAGVAGTMTAEGDKKGFDLISHANRAAPLAKGRNKDRLPIHVPEGDTDAGRAPKEARPVQCAMPRTWEWTVGITPGVDVLLALGVALVYKREADHIEDRSLAPAFT